MTAPPEIPGAQHRFVQIDTADAGPLRVHYAEAGQGPPLLLLHGWPQHFWCWRRVVPQLAGEFRLICPDLRGFGWTGAPGRGYDNETFAADAVALLDALELERAGVIGHDWGGFTSFLLALHHPDRVKALLALSTPIPWLRPSPRVLASTWRTWYAWALAAIGREAVSRRPGAVRLMLRRGTPDAAIDESEAEVYAERLREPARAEATQLLYRGYLRSVLELRERRYESLRLTLPTRLVVGRGDQAVPEAVVTGFEPHADDMALEIVDGCGHFVPEERPDLVVRHARALFAA
ncbi:MAG TPA: alpha/beta hydrolase [Thermoleophilaceae bacterium]|nr:alpha/beta hydrolase [Thermoleophilaceae bacterium]